MPTPDLVDLDALEASGGLVDLDADPDFAQAAPLAGPRLPRRFTGNEPDWAKRAEEAIKGTAERLGDESLGGIKGAVQGVANIGRVAGLGTSVPDSMRTNEDRPAEARGAAFGRALPGLAVPVSGLGTAAFSGALGGAGQTGEKKDALLGAAAGTAFHGAAGLVGKVRELVSALKANPALAKAVMRTAEQVPLGIGGQVRQTRKFMEAAGGVKKTLAGEGAATKTVTGGEKAAELVTPSPKRAAEAEFKGKVAATRTAPQLDEITPELVQQQGVAMAEKRINAALAKGDMKTARSLLEKVNKEYGVKLNLRDLVKGKS
jgi:hypothetical protein